MSDSDHAKVWELVRTEDGEADAARRAGEVGQRQRGSTAAGVEMEGRSDATKAWSGLGALFAGIIAN